MTQFLQVRSLYLIYYEFVFLHFSVCFFECFMFSHKYGYLNGGGLVAYLRKIILKTKESLRCQVDESYSNLPPKTNFSLSFSKLSVWASGKSF